MQTTLPKKILILLLLTVSCAQAAYNGDYDHQFFSFFDSVSPEKQETVIAEQTRQHFAPGYDAGYDSYLKPTPPPDAVLYGSPDSQRFYYQERLYRKRNALAKHKKEIAQNREDSSLFYNSLSTMALGFATLIPKGIQNHNKVFHIRNTKFGIYLGNACVGGFKAISFAWLPALYQYFIMPKNKNQRLLFSHFQLFYKYVLLDMAHKYAYDILATKMPLHKYDEKLQKRIPHYNFLKDKAGWLAKTALAAHQSHGCVSIE